MSGQRFFGLKQLCPPQHDVNNLVDVGSGVATSWLPDAGALDLQLFVEFVPVAAASEEAGRSITDQNKLFLSFVFKENKRI